MYCRNCGNPVDNNATVCPRCGCAKGTGLSYCPRCGQPTALNASVCDHCGTDLRSGGSRWTAGSSAASPDPRANIPAQYSRKNKVIAGLLAIFLGYFGIHNFYLGYTGKAIAQLLLTILSCGTLCIVSEIWAFVEAILIFAGKIATDANGVPLQD